MTSGDSILGIAHFEESKSSGLRDGSRIYRYLETIKFNKHKRMEPTNKQETLKEIRRRLCPARILLVKSINRRTSDHYVRVIYLIATHLIVSLARIILQLGEQLPSYQFVLTTEPGGAISSS